MKSAHVRRSAGAVGIAAVLALAAACSSSASDAASSSPSPGSGAEVKIGLVVPLTGAISAGFAGFVNAAQARVDLANAAAGSTHQIKLIVADDQSTPQGALAAAQSLVAQGVAAVEVAAPTDFDGAAQAYVSGHSIPIISPNMQTEGEFKDPNNYSILGVGGSAAPPVDALGAFLKSQGVQSVALVGWGEVEASVDLLKAEQPGLQEQGVKTALEDVSSTPTTTDYTSVALAVKKSGAQTVYAAMTVASEASLDQALLQQGVPLKAVVNFPTVFESSSLTGPDAAAFNNTYFLSAYAPQGVDAPGAKTFAQAASSGRFADGENEKDGFIESDLLVQALSSVKGTVTPASLTEAIRGITSYNADGLLANTVSFAPKSRGSDQNVQKCNWYVQIKAGKFVVLQQQPVCAKIIG